MNNKKISSLHLGVIYMSERRFNPDSMAKLDNPERYKLIPIEEILANLDVTKTDNVLDLGAGTGYFTFPVAEKTSGTVYALDIEQKMLEALNERNTRLKMDNIELVKGLIENIPMENNQVHRAIASMVLHEIEPLSKGLQEVKRVLKDDGQCILVEWEKVETESGPPLHHRIHSQEMKKAVEMEGFIVTDISFPSKAIYTMTFKK